MAASTGNLVALAEKILENAKAIEAYHRANNLQLPSLDEHGGSKQLYPPTIERTRAIVSEACEELNAIVQGPMKSLQTRVLPHVIYFDVINRFQIAHKVPLDGKISYSDLSKSTGVSETALKRVLRFAISCNVFAEKEPGYISHSAASRWLVEEPTASAWLAAYRETTMPAQVALGQALQRWPNADESSETGYMIANDVNVSWFYDHLAEDPERVKNFSMAMKNFANSPGNAMSHLVDNYPWGEIGSGTVVDMGGSTGAAAFAIAEKYPALKFVVQDLPDTVAQVKEKPDLNVKFMAHSYFDEQPVHGADVYMSRWCFHNNSDKYCIKILKALIPALKPGARVLIMDAVLPDITSTAVPAGAQRMLRNMDCTMMSLTNAMEREAGDWRRLFDSADRRLQLKNITEPEGSTLALIEAVWQP